MKFLFGGCSHTWGAELNHLTREQKRYSHIVCQHFGAEETNISIKGASIPYTTYKLYSEISKSDFDLCVVQITYATRLVFPIHNEIYNLNLNRSALHRPPVKPSDIYLKKIILSHNDPEDRKNFWDIHGYHLNMFEDSCKMRNIKTLYFCTDTTRQEKFIKERCPSLDLLDIGLFEYLNKNNLPIARYGHPLEESHEAWAKNVLIPEIEKRL